MRPTPSAPPLVRRTTSGVAAVVGLVVGSGVAVVRHLRTQGVQTGPKTVRSAVTVAVGRADAEGRWATEAAAAGVPEGTTVRFAEAPGGRGTEVHASHDGDGGRLAHPFAALHGTAPDQRLKDGLRRWKQVVETGEVVRSDGVPDGHSATSQPKQHAAQPVGASA